MHMPLKMTRAFFCTAWIQYGIRKYSEVCAMFQAGVDGGRERNHAVEVYRPSLASANCGVPSITQRGWGRVVSLLGALLLVQLVGCASVGPPTVKRDRFDYVVAISNSFKRQTLLNIVKSRYLDVPVYMDINSVISQYAIEGELGFELAPSVSDNNLLLGHGTYADRPTITYTPLTGEKYSRSLLTPLPISSIFLLLQSGYPVDLILHVCVQTINGIDNQRTGPVTATQVDPRFVDALTLMRELQEIDGLYYRIEAAGKRYDVKVVFRAPAGREAEEKSARLKQLFGLDAKANVFHVVFGAQASDNTEIAVMTRSMAQIMSEYAADIDVPQSDIDEGRVRATRSVSTGPTTSMSRLIRVRHGTTPPKDAYVAVSYRGRWYWVADTDLLSKASLQFVMTLFSFTERGTAEQQAPVITVPTN